MKRSKFSLSHYKLATMDMGRLYPIACLDVLPGDSIQQATTALVRMQPMLAPVMHPIEVKIHHWFVPYRLLWSEFEDFITGGSRGTSVPTFPTITSNFRKGELGDYLGLIGEQEVSALPFRAYNMIWNDFYRDQDLQTEIDINTDGGNDTDTYEIKRVSWAKDYFTTARPWTQKGTEINVPVEQGGNFDITGLKLQAHKARYNSTTGQWEYPAQNITAMLNNLGNETDIWFKNGFDTGSIGTIPSAHRDNVLGFGVANTGTEYPNGPDSGYLNINASNGITLTPRGGSSNRGISIQDLRLSLALQRYEEARAKYGSRYIEYLRYLGIRSSDARLQLPEYLGGGKQLIQISEVLNTSGQGTLGAMGGHGLGAMRSNRYRRFFEEHGVILSLMYIMPKAMYVEGTHRMWLKRTKEDFFQKELQHIGMQEVYTRELKGTAENGKIFGYQDRYDEYRRQPSQVCGDFRDLLDFWHLGRTFESDPVLNESFITNEPTKRIFAEQNHNEFLLMINHSIQARRMLRKVAKTATF